MNLDNSIKEKSAASKPDERQDVRSMATRQRFHVTLINGEQVWLTGRTMDDVFDNAFRKYAYLYKDVCEQWDTRPDCPTVREYAQTWLETYKRQKVGAGRYQSLQMNLRKHLLPVIGDERLDDVKFQDVQEVIDRMNQDGLAKGSQEVVLKLARNIFDYAIEDKYIHENVFKSKKICITKEESEPRRSLSQSEVDKLLLEVDKLDSFTDKLLICIPLYTGMRKGEVMALKWSDIDFKKRFIHVQRNLAAGYETASIEKDTKTEAGKRFIPIPDKLYDLLIEFKKKSNSEYVIATRSGKRYANNGAAVYIKNLFKTVQMPDDITYHCLRHTYATAMSTKVDPKTLQAILGHSNISVTMNTYVHRDMESIQNNAYLFNHIYEN